MGKGWFTTLLSLAVWVAVSPCAHAQCVVDISTGFDQGAGAVLAEGVDDDDYTIGSADGPAALTGGASTGFPVPPWVANDDQSIWISNAANSSADPGLYTYEINVTLPGEVDPAAIAIVGEAAADDGFSDILVNGTSAGSFGAPFNTFSPIPPNFAQGLFVAGDNQIQFIVSNGGDAANPSGLRLRACLEALEVPVAEERDIDISTGFDREALATIANGEPDPRYTVTGPEGSGIGPMPAVVINDNAFPIPPWLPSTVQSKWIGTQADSNGPPGIYVYSIDVEVPAEAEAPLLALKGGFAADNAVIDVRVNGFSTGMQTAGFSELRAFSRIPGLFATGTNTIEFFVRNDGDVDGPAGLRVDGEVAPCPEAPVPVPEDTSIDTGFDGGLIANLMADPQFIVVGPDLCATTPIVLDDTIFPIAPAGPWIATTARSKWIGVSADSNAPPGLYVYRTVVTVPGGVDPATVSLVGAWTSDNGGLTVRVNDTDVGWGHDGNFTFLHPFGANVGLGLFAAGANTIDFVVDNAAPGNNPTGLHVKAEVVAVTDAWLPGDCSRNGSLDISDVICLVRATVPGFNLFDRTTPEAPCGGDPVARLVVLDVNGDNAVSTADVVALAQYLFDGGPAPARGADCTGVLDCVGVCN